MVLAFLEVLILSSIVALYPACLVQMHRLPTAAGTIFVFETVLDYLKLQLAYRSHDAAVVELVDKELCHTLVHQLFETLDKLLRLHGVVVLNVFEQFRRETGQATEVHQFALGQRIANLEDAVVGQTYDVAGISLVDGRFALRHKLRGRREAHGLPQSYMRVGLVALETARANLAESDTRTVVGVDIGGNLEDEAAEFRFRRFHHTLLGLGGARARCYLYKAVEQFLHTEVVERAAKKHRCHIGRPIGVHLKGRIHAVYQFQIIAELLCLALTHVLVQFLTGNVYLHLLRHALFVGREEVELLLIDIVHTLEAQALADRP